MPYCLLNTYSTIRFYWTQIRNYNNDSLALTETCYFDLIDILTKIGLLSSITLEKSKVET